MVRRPRHGLVPSLGVKPLPELAVRPLAEFATELLAELGAELLPDQDNCHWIWSSDLFTYVF